MDLEYLKWVAENYLERGGSDRKMAATRPLSRAAEPCIAAPVFDFGAGRRYDSAFAYSIWWWLVFFIYKWQKILVNYVKRSEVIFENLRNLIVHVKPKIPQKYCLDSQPFKILTLDSWFSTCYTSALPYKNNIYTEVSSVSSFNLIVHPGSFIRW